MVNDVATTGIRTCRLDPAAQKLLLLAARGSWDDAQRAKAIQLARGVVDWTVFCDVAIRAFGVCLAYRLLVTLPTDAIPSQVMGRMQQASRMFAVRSLQIEAVQLEFTSNCLVPLGVRHAFFKGASLAHRYHADPAARPCRDVDVLIDPARTLETVRYACELGYVPDKHVGTSESDLAAWVKRATVQEMRAPNGILIEIHQSLDHGDGRLDVDQMLSRVEIIDFRGRSMPVLHTADLFVYMCMHHTRHFWSHLQWYADLDAIIGHPLFDIAAVRKLASDVGMGSTIEACLQLNDFARSANWPDKMSPKDGPGEALLVRSIECLEGGLEHEFKLRAGRLSDDRAFVWQAKPHERIVLWVHRVRKQCLRGWNFLLRHARGGQKSPAYRREVGVRNKDNQG